MVNRYIIITIIIGLICNSCVSQKLMAYKVKYIDDISVKKNTELDIARKLMREKKLSKIYFGTGFAGEKVKVYNNDKCILDTTIFTNKSIELSLTSLYINTSEQNLFRITISDNELVFAYDIRFLFLIIEKKDEKLELVYSNNKQNRW